MQKEAATSLEGRAAVLIGEAAREEETYQQIHGQGVLMNARGQDLVAKGVCAEEFCVRVRVCVATQFCVCVCVCVCVEHDS